MLINNKYNGYSHQLHKKCLQRIIIYVNYKLHTIMTLKFFFFFFFGVTFKRLEVILEILRHIVAILENLKGIFNSSMVLGAIFFFFFWGQFSGLKENVLKIRKMTISIKCFMPKQTIPNMRKMN